MQKLIFSAEGRLRCEGVNQSLARPQHPCTVLQAIRSRPRFRRLLCRDLMKVIPIITAIAGLAVIGALVGYFGAGAVIRSLRAIGWAGFSAICAIYLGVISLEGIAWRLLVPRRGFGHLYGGA